MVVFIIRFLVVSSFLLLPVASAADFNEKELQNRVKSRWESIIEHKFSDVYQYETPTYKAVFPKKLFVNQFSDGVDWVLTKVGDVKFDPITKVATIIVAVETKPRNSKGLDAKAKVANIEIREKWLRIKGQWWHSSSS